MQLYKIFDTDLEPAQQAVKYRGTMADAQEVMRATSAEFRPAVQIDLVEAKNDKPNFLAALNGDNLPDEPKVLKSWRGTNRGGVKEMGSES